MGRAEVSFAANPLKCKFSLLSLSCRMQTFPLIRILFFAGAPRSRTPLSIRSTARIFRKLCKMPPTLRQKNLATKPAQICDPPYSRNRSATRRRKASSPPNSSAPPTGQDNCGLELITVGFDFSTSNSVAVVEAKYGSNRELHQITHYPEHIDPTGEGPGIFTQSWYKDPSHPSSDPNQPSFLHGWEVMRMLGTKDRRIIGYHDGRRVERMKLLLDSSTHDTTLKAIESTVTVTNQDAHEQSSDQLSISVRHDLLNAIQESRKRLNVIAKRLVDEGIITQPTDVIKDWLVKWFMHIQEEVTNIHGYTESVPGNCQTPICP